MTCSKTKSSHLDQMFDLTSDRKWERISSSVSVNDSIQTIFDVFDTFLGLLKGLRIKLIQNQNKLTSWLIPDGGMSTMVEILLPGCFLLLA